MASKRDLKKKIRYACGETAFTCIFTRDFMDVKDAEAFDKILADIANLEARALNHVNFSFDKRQADFENHADYRKQLHQYRKKAYASLIDDVNNSLAAIVKEMNAQLSDGQRNVNKEVAKPSK